MQTDSVARKFEKIGARIEHRERVLRRWLPFSLGIAIDRRGEKFEVVSAPASDVEMWVPDVQLSTRHLILQMGQSRPTAARHGFLCGFDERQPVAATWRWTSMTRDAEVFVRGSIRHPDHRTLHLAGWHRVLPNREDASNSLAFLD